MGRRVQSSFYENQDMGHVVFNEKEVFPGGFRKVSDKFWMFQQRFRGSWRGLKDFQSGFRAVSRDDQ